MQNAQGDVEPSSTDLRRTVLAIVLSLAIAGVVWALIVTFHVA